MPSRGVALWCRMPEERQCTLPIHVVHIVESFGAGCLVAIAMICRHVRDGIRHTVIYSTRPETPADFASLFPDGTDFIHVPMSKSLTGNNLAALRALDGVLRQLGPVHCVHCHSSIAGLLGRMVAKRHGLPTVYTPHGYAFLRTDIGPLRQKLFWLAEWALARMTTAVAACGEEEYSLARNMAPNPSGIVCIPNSVDLTALQAVLDLPQAGVPPSPQLPLVGTSGRPEPQHNPALFAGLATALADKARWIWVGGQGAQLPSHVETTAWLPRQEALRRIMDLSVYVQTSDWEGLSYSILEAMALGRPVVASDIPANRALVRHGVSGFLARNRREYIEYIDTLLQDAALREKMGQAGMAQIRESHDASRNYRAFAELYRATAQGAPLCSGH